MGNLVLVTGVAVAFAALLLFAQFVYWTIQSRSEQHQRELARRLGTLTEKSDADTVLLRPASEESRGLAAHFDDLIRQAGSPYTLSTFYTRVVVAGVIGVLIAAVALKSPAAIVGAALAYLPVSLLTRAAEARAARLAEQLPDGLDLLARSLQAGHGFSEAMRSVAEEIPAPLGQEFGRVHEENNLGRDFRESLANLCRRNPNSFDLQIFVSSVLLQRDTGGNLVEILQSISGTIRSRFLFRGKVHALTSEARFTAWILGGLPFFVLGVIVVLSPKYLTPLFQDPLGTVMLMYCGASFALGIFVMREVSQVEL